MDFFFLILYRNKWTDYSRNQPFWNQTMLFVASFPGIFFCSSVCVHYTLWVHIIRTCYYRNKVKGWILVWKVGSLPWEFLLDHALKDLCSRFCLAAFSWDYTHYIPWACIKLKQTVIASRCIMENINNTLSKCSS